MLSKIIQTYQNLFTTSKHPEPELPKIVFEGAVNVPKIGCFCSDDISGLLTLSGTPEYPFSAIKAFVKTTSPSETMFDFMDIDSISTSKSDTKYFPTIEIFGEDTLNEIKKIEPLKIHANWSVDACKSHIDSDLFGRGSTQIKIIRWNNRVEVDNSGGSHHFAVLRYYMSIGEAYSFSTMIKIMTFERFIDEELVKDTINKFQFFIVSHETHRNIVNTYNGRTDFKAMERVYRHDDGKKNDWMIAISLTATQEANRRTDLIAELFDASVSSPDMCLDLNTYIKERIRQQG